MTEDFFLTIYGSQILQITFEFHKANLKIYISHHLIDVMLYFKKQIGADNEILIKHFKVFQNANKIIMNHNKIINLKKSTSNTSY